MEMRPTFEILIAQEHKAILDSIHAFFGVGKVIINGKNAVFRVQVLSELVNVIIPHFTAFPLITTKVITFTVWAQAVALFSAGAHKTEEGFMQIVSIYAAIGRGVSKTVAVHFPNLQPVSLPKYELTTTVEQAAGTARRARLSPGGCLQPPGGCLQPPGGCLQPPDRLARMLMDFWLLNSILHFPSIYRCSWMEKRLLPQIQTYLFIFT